MTVHRQQIELLILNLVCGSAVLISYAHGLFANPSAGGALWGEVPPWLMPFYTASMLTAAAGYLAFTFYILLAVNPGEARIGRHRYRIFLFLYGVVLVPSALWMPLTFEMIRDPSAGIWIAIRIVLAAVGLGSIGIFTALVMMRPRRPSWAFGIAVAGAVAFIVQTALLDALVWTAFFPFSL
ncbi:MAG TPA: hypothetical protein PLM53_15760 [Spirochaetota bacterium]|nr:hypothetical protein [Spirochaetota bacterium]HPL15191.1 hypothetical protein [Spirochaetota bacterium]HQF09901.1 hypothetical protein [Spirochaetota bacterium]HQH98552.1 hypothetical protein [Spirochaetota bacterium]HQJ71976.1 hypothetical protein [Spirochaetota bacterium]